MLIAKGFEDQMEIQKGYKAILALAVPS
jgi:hypothetical protein